MQDYTEEVSDKYTVDQSGNVLNYLDTINLVYEVKDNYEVYSDETKTSFYYIVRDNYGNILDVGYHSYRGSFSFEYQNELLIMNYGVGGNVWHERYYDVSNGNTSRFFERPIANSEELVAYFEVKDSNEIVLVVQDIFDSSKYYFEIDRDFSDYVLKDCVEAEFLEDNTKLEISYWINPNNEYVSETIDLFV